MNGSDDVYSYHYVIEAGSLRALRFRHGEDRAEIATVAIGEKPEIGLWSPAPPDLLRRLMKNERLLPSTPTWQLQSVGEMYARDLRLVLRR